MKYYIFLLSIFGTLTTVFSLSACGPTQEELHAQATQVAASVYSTQAAEAPTRSSTPIITQTPTLTSTSLPTTTETPMAQLGSFNITPRILEATSEPTISALTPDLKATAAYEATQAAEAIIAEIDKVLQMADLSTEMGSLLWVQPESVQIRLSSFSEWVNEPFDGDPTASDFVLYSEVTWESTGGLAGCNLIFRSEPNFEEGAQYDFETIRLSGLPGWDIVYYNNGEVQKNVTGILTAGVIDQGQGAMNKILLIAEENKFTVYFNDKRIGSYFDYSKNRLDGLFAFEAWQESGETTCTYENTWVWSLN